MPLTADDIADAATDPASASAGGQSATAVPIPDQIAAAKFQAATTATAGTNANGGPRSGWGATRPARVIPPGAV